MSLPYDPNNAEHTRIVRNAADAAWALCGNPVEAAQQALLNRGIGLAPMGDLGDLLIELQCQRRELAEKARGRR